MPTDLPPDYKPKPANDPADPVVPDVPGSKPAYPPASGDDSRDPGSPAGNGHDLIDPPGWPAPPVKPGDEPDQVPLPAGTPTF